MGRYLKHARLIEEGVVLGDVITADAPLVLAPGHLLDNLLDRQRPIQAAVDLRYTSLQ
jgi:hypothetical protein